MYPRSFVRKVHELVFKHAKVFQSTKNGYIYAGKTGKIASLYFDGDLLWLCYEPQEPHELGFVCDGHVHVYDTYIRLAESTDVFRVSELIKLYITP